MADHDARDANVGGEILFHGCSEKGSEHVTYWQTACDGTNGVTATVEDNREDEGAEGPAFFVVHDDVEVKFENGVVKVAQGSRQPGAGDVRNGARPGGEPGRRRDQGLREEARDHRRRLPAALQGKNLQARGSATATT